MQEALQMLEKWMKKRAMTINESECEYLLTTWNKYRQVNLTLNNNKINRNNHPKFLGIDFNWNLTFKQQTEKII